MHCEKSESIRFPWPRCREEDIVQNALHVMKWSMGSSRSCYYGQGYLRCNELTLQSLQNIFYFQDGYVVKAPHVTVSEVFQPLPKAASLPEWQWDLKERQAMSVRPNGHGRPAGLCWHMKEKRSKKPWPQNKLYMLHWCSSSINYSFLFSDGFMSRFR